MKNFFQKGITLIEFIFVVIIIVVIAVIILPSLSNFKEAQALKNTNEEIISILNKAKLDTSSSLDSSSYSVLFDEDKVIYFKGTSFNINDPLNETIILDESIEIPDSGVNLNGGGSIVSFSKLTGDVVGYGTIILRIKNDTTKQKIININRLGIISNS